MQRNAVIRCDASALIGSGHVSRCLALAQGLAGAGWRVAFAVGPETTAAAPWLDSSGFEIIILGSGSEGEVGELRERLPAGCHTLIVDHYGRGAAWEAAARGWAQRIVAIDDCTGRQHDCDFLIDSGACGSEAYSGLVPAGCNLLLGPSHALIRAEFQRRRQEALSRRQSSSGVERILVAFGSTDPWNATGAALSALRDVLPEIQVRVVLASRAPHLEQVRSEIDRRTCILLDTVEMAALMAEADVAIGAAGATAFERATLGLPTLAGMLVENQAAIHRLMVAAGAAFDVGPLGEGFGARLRDGLEKLVCDAAARARMSACAAALVDGRGAGRVAEALAA